MNAYKYEDLKLGMTESFSRKITAEMMESFLASTGDENPLHTDDRFTKEHGFDGRVVYGMLSASLFSTLAGMYLPGRYCLIQQVEAKFKHPVFINDVLEVQGTVKELNDSVRQAVIRVEVRNSTGMKVIRGHICVGFLE